MGVLIWKLFSMAYFLQKNPTWPLSLHREKYWIASCRVLSVLAVYAVYFQALGKIHSWERRSLEVWVERKQEELLQKDTVRWAQCQLLSLFCIFTLLSLYKKPLQVNRTCQQVSWSKQKFPVLTHNSQTCCICSSWHERWWNTIKLNTENSPSSKGSPFWLPRFINLNDPDPAYFTVFNEFWLQRLQFPLINIPLLFNPNRADAKPQRQILHMQLLCIQWSFTN